MINHASGNGSRRARVALAAVLGVISLACYLPRAVAAEAKAEAEEKTEEKEAVLQEVQITGSRIVRKDLQSNSPVTTLDREKLDDNTFISVEQALNEMPQFMAGGSAIGAFGNQTGIGQFTAGNNMDGGSGSGNMFDNTRLPDNGGRIGTFTPGAAVVNLRGLGSNRSLTLIDGHRGQPTNASGVVDLNTIPSAAIGNIEVITGGASAVYGADALAGVTNIKLRDNYEGLSVRVRGGINEVGDGGEYQVSTVMGTRLSGKGSALIGIQYDKRETSLYRNRSWYEEAISSPYSNFLNMTFPAIDYYSAGTNTPSQTAVNTLFGNRVCTTGSGVTVPCVTTTGGAAGTGFVFNTDGSLYTRSSSCYLPNYGTTTAPTSCTVPTGTVAAAGTTHYFGPQNFKGSVVNSQANPVELTCQYVASQPNHTAGFSDRSCNPTVNMVDWDRWLSSPREAYTLFGRAKYELNDSLRAYSVVNFSTSDTETRREATPASGGFAANIPFGATVGGNINTGSRYLPSIETTEIRRNGVLIRPAGATKPEYVSTALGGTNTRGTDCPAMGGCTMAQAFPVSTDLRRLLESRALASGGVLPGPTGGGVNAATNPFQGLSSCITYSRNPNPSVPSAPVQVNPTTGIGYTYAIDPNTGQPTYTCGPNGTWAYNTSFDFIPVRGTHNTQRTWSLAFGLEGDLPFSDWTWDLYNSKGEGNTVTNFQGFVSLYNYRLLMSQPNYGKGYVNNAGSGKFMSCESGLNPFSNAPVSQDCVEAVASAQIDRSSTDQRVHEFSAQGHLFEMPAGEARGAIGASYRKNNYQYTPDSLRERDYINDTSAGQFGVGSVVGALSVKEVYGEMLIPLLRDLPGVQNLELEIGGRYSEYSTGQNVPTWKVLASWQPVSWIRARGGFNKAERAPNIAELFTRDSVNANGIVTDPCVVPSATTVQNTLTNIAEGDNLTPLSTFNDPQLNPDYLKLQALCRAQIEAAGGSGASDFDLDPNNFGRTPGSVPTGLVVVSGNPDLKSEKGQTWTAGVVFSSPFTHPLLSRITSTFDWYEARIDDPIEIVSPLVAAWECFNAYGNNPNFQLDDPRGYCSVIERDPVIGGIRYVQTPYLNRGKLVIRGMDVSMNWSAAMADMGLESLSGRLSIGINANFLFDQIQAVTAGGTTRDYAGVGGAAPFQASTTVGYSWGYNRVSANWRYRSGTCIAVNGAAGCDDDISRYPISNQFSLTGGTRIGPVNASLSVSNPLNTKPRTGTYSYTDPTKGFGSFNPFDDLVGRRWSMNLSMDF